MDATSCLPSQNPHKPNRQTNLNTSNEEPLSEAWFKNYDFPTAENCHRRSKTLRPSRILGRLPAKPVRSVSSLNSRQPCTISISESAACFTRKLSLRQLKGLTMTTTSNSLQKSCNLYRPPYTLYCIFIAMLTNEFAAAHNIQ